MYTIKTLKARVFKDMMNGGDVNCITDVFHEPGKTDEVFDFEVHHSFNREIGPGTHVTFFMVDHQLEGILVTP